jgi:hypothetical protein
MHHFLFGLRILGSIVSKAYPCLFDHREKSIYPGGSDLSCRSGDLGRSYLTLRPF